MDDGKFRMRIFGKEQRIKKDIRATEIRFNELFGLNSYSMPIDEFPDPFITCCFINDDQIFVNFFHNNNLTHYHFIWDIKNHKVIGKPLYDVSGNSHNDLPITYKFQTNSINFPYKCFYSEKFN